MIINSTNMKPLTSTTIQKSNFQEVSSDSISLGMTSPSGFMNDLNQLRQMSETGKIEGTSSIGSKEFWVNQATHMTDFFAQVSKDEIDGGFYTHIDSAGKVANENEKFLMPTSRQIYSYAATYELTEHFTDKENGGFFDSVKSGTFEANKTKSYNSTVYPATSALLDMADIAEGDWKKEVLSQLKDLSGNFIKYFPDPSTGFIKENFTSDWKEDWRDWQKQPEGSIGVTGHNTQGALFLLRAEKLLSKEGLLTAEESKAYKDSAKNILDSILEKGYDKENGGWFDVFVRETGKNMWHTNKAFWQQEEGYLATLAMSKIDSDPKYKEATDKTLQFWDKYFIDREVGGDRQTVAKDGTALTDPKGGPGKSSYHAVEMAKLALEIGKW